MIRRIPIAESWAAIEPHVERWLADHTMTLADVSAATGLTPNTVRHSLERMGVHRSPEIALLAYRYRGVAIRRSIGAQRFPDIKPAAKPVRPAQARYPSVWHYASGVSIGGGLRNVREERA